ncbi:hypothetical protein M3Y99_00516700 [Aphelenchoides fujianensis]|nr:hypothetical protein M3Y99_00516700 [Aphelenchoides fujianensis]
MADVAFAAAQTDFAVGLLQEAAAFSNASLILSPISIAFALSLAYAGAGGDTRHEFEAVFARGTNTGDALDAAFPRSVKAAYRELLAANFGAAFQQVDFKQEPKEAAREINDFVAKATHDKIRDLLPPDAVDADTRMLLVNAIYFKGGWSETFNGRTTNATFFVDEDNKQQVELPRFKITSEFQLKEVLNRLGFTEGFKPTADFSGIFEEPAYIAQGYHKAFIDVDENGSSSSKSISNSKRQMRTRKPTERTKARDFWNKPPNSAQQLHPTVQAMSD